MSQQKEDVFSVVCLFSPSLLLCFFINISKKRGGGEKGGERETTIVVMQAFAERLHALFSSCYRVCILSPLPFASPQPLI